MENSVLRIAGKVCGPQYSEFKSSSQRSFPARIAVSLNEDTGTSAGLTDCRLFSFGYHVSTAASLVLSPFGMRHGIVEDW